MMVYILASFVIMCAFLGVTEALVWVWEKLHFPENVKEDRTNGNTHRDIC